MTLAYLLVFPIAPAFADPGPATPEQSAPGQRPAFAEQTKAPAPETPSPYRFEILASGLNRPWGMTFLPDDRMLVTERGGSMRLVASNGQISETLAGVPEVRTGGTAGLLDVSADPDFGANNLIYFSYLEPRGDVSGIAVARARLNAEDAVLALADVTVIFRAEPAVKGNENVGTRLLFGRDGMLYVALGDRFTSPEQAQDLGSDLGKIVRIRSDGTVPMDNPFLAMSGARPEIYALGFRNPEGLAIDPSSGALWELENGAKGGDELNRITGGGNYGWPVISYGRNYNDTTIGTGTAMAGLQQPVYYWDPSIAPSGFTFYDGDQFPDWKGNIFVAALKGQHISRIELVDGRVVMEEQMLGELRCRIRTIEQGPDGALYVLTDEENARLVRVLPAELLTRN